MFVTGHISQKQGVSHKIYAAGSVLPVLSAADLLASSRHQGVLRQLRGMVFMEDSDYAKYYETVLNNFAEFVQVLPRDVNGPLSRLLNEGISRATIAVKTYLASVDDVDPLVLYAVFTAALLRDVSRAITNYKVIVCEEGGTYIDDWQPFIGSLVGQGEFYKLYPLAPVYQRLDDKLVPLLARQLMPKEGFMWIASDLQLFADWLDVLSGEEGQGGSVSHTLSLMRQDEFLNLLNALVDVQVEMMIGEDTKYGDLFYAWLKDGIASGEIAVNTTDAGVFMTVDGVFLERNKVFHSFAERSKLPVNMNVVFAQFGNLFGIANKGGGDYMNAQYFSDAPAGKGGGKFAFSSPLASRQRSLRSGMLLSDPAMVFMNAQIPATTSLIKSLQTRTPASHQMPTQIVSNSPGHKMK